MLIGAFVSLPIQAVDLTHRHIKQYPSLGVRTKNRKFGDTYLLDIPKLLSVIETWDVEVRAALPPDGFWFAPLSPLTGKINPGMVSIGEHRVTLARRNLKAWLTKAGLPYHSPHKFRHGHIHYGNTHARTIEDFKAVSMNVMHSNMKTTDEFYSNLNDAAVRSRISALGTAKGESSSRDVQLNEYREFLVWREVQSRK
jgi:integrase